MVGHLDVPGLTTDLPSSLTPAVYALLREDYGFDGVVFTDDLGAMKAVTGRFDLPEAVRAGAGRRCRRGPVVDRGPGRPGAGPAGQALSAGRLDPAANDRAVARVLPAKGVCSSRS